MPSSLAFHYHIAFIISAIIISRTHAYHNIDHSLAPNIISYPRFLKLWCRTFVYFFKPFLSFADSKIHFGEIKFRLGAFSLSAFMDEVENNTRIWRSWRLLCMEMSADELDVFNCAMWIRKMKYGGAEMLINTILTDKRLNSITVMVNVANRITRR